jgi:hypothetical protein
MLITQLLYDYGCFESALEFSNAVLKSIPGELTCQLITRSIETELSSTPPGLESMVRTPQKTSSIFLCSQMEYGGSATSSPCFT